VTVPYRVINGGEREREMGKGLGFSPEVSMLSVGWEAGRQIGSDGVRGFRGEG